MPAAMRMEILSIPIELEHDVILCRNRCREIADAVGLGAQDQMKIATAVSEIARNAFSYAGGGTATFTLVDSDPERYVEVTISDEGPGIENLKEILEGRYRSETGMGQGILASHRLMDLCRVESAPDEGTRVTLRKDVPRTTPKASKDELRRIAEQNSSPARFSLVDQIRAQNRELLTAIEELTARKDELEKLNAELEEKEARIRAMLRQDPLTQVGNRRLLDERLPVELDRCRRLGHPLAVAMVDIDHFKRINDGWGHGVGDQVLHDVAQALAGNVRKYDMVCRYGGEEFAIILPETSSENALVVCERLRELVEALEVASFPGRVTASFGVSGRDTRIADEILASADHALYDAKDRGRNRVVLED